jgi:hypothetical protein
VAAAEPIESRPAAFRAVPWRAGAGGPLEAGFAAPRVRVADGPADASGRHLPGDEAWPVGEPRAGGEKRSHPSDLPADAPLAVLAAPIEARRACERLHQRPKDGPGLDHFEGRSRRGLHHHALLRLPAFAFLRHPRLGGEKRRKPARARSAEAEPARRAPADRGRAHPRAPLPPPPPAALRAPSPAPKVAG